MVDQGGPQTSASARRRVRRGTIRWHPGLRAGRLTAAQAGVRTATVAYDDLDRAVRIGLDGGTLATYDYARADADAALATDRITARIPVPWGMSAVFGTMETVVYTRPAPMDFGPVAYVPALRTFVATHRHLVPDAVLASSLDRRMLPWRGGDVDGRPFGTDKPSGSLFIPPEYRSVNCHVCTSSLEVASVGAPTAPVAGALIDIVVGAVGPCELPPGVDVPVVASWHHAVSFGDGGTTTATGSSATRTTRRAPTRSATTSRARRASPCSRWARQRWMSRSNRSTGSGSRHSEGTT